jgi:hypothetical protein
MNPVVGDPSRGMKVNQRLVSTLTRSFDCSAAIASGSGPSGISAQMTKPIPASSTTMQIANRIRRTIFDILITPTLVNWHASCLP